MSEWSIVQSWNGCVRQRTPGSNPGLCANQNSVEPAVFYLLERDLASFTCLANFLFARTRGTPFVLGYSSVCNCHPSITVHFVLSMRIPELYRKKIVPFMGLLFAEIGRVRRTQLLSAIIRTFTCRFF